MQACLRIRDGGMADAPSFSGRVSPPELRLARLTSRSHPRKLFSRVLCADSRGTLTTKRTTKQRKPAKKQKEPQDAKGGNAFSQLYWNFTGFPFPLGPIVRRRTLRFEVEKDRIWMFEQQQALAFSNVTINVRMTAILLKGGGLWIHAPIAPTEECIKLVKELGHPVQYIVLPTFAYEHKVFVGPFSRRFPDAEVYVAPRQWSWPIQLPPQAFGIFSRGTLLDDDDTTPWASEIKQKVFSASVGFGPYSEAAFYHVPSRTLLVTDAVIQVPSQPPEVIPEWALQNSGRRVPFPISAVCKGENEQSPPPPEDLDERRVLGWMRMALLILYFVPFDLLTPQESFRAVSDKLFVSPVVRTLVFTKASRTEVRAWVESICRDWDFTQCIPAHFDAPISTRPADFREAFSFLFDEVEGPASAVKPAGFLAGLFGRAARSQKVQTEFPYNDMRGLRAIESTLQRANVINKD